MSWWESLLSWINEDQARGDRHREYWVVCQAVPDRRTLQHEMSAGMLGRPEYGNVQVTDGLLFDQGRWTVLFYSNRELKRARPGELDGVLMVSHDCLYIPQLKAGLKERDGWMRFLSEMKGECRCEPCEERNAR